VIELAMVRRMTKRGLLLAPLLVVSLALVGGAEYAISGAAGIALTLVNLWIAARIIGGVAESSPQLLMPAALGAFALGLMVLTGIALVLESLRVVFFPVTGLVLVGSHLLLVLWEAAGAYNKIEAKVEPRSPGARS
jgi:ATP synthase protein I